MKNQFNQNDEFINDCFNLASREDGFIIIDGIKYSFFSKNSNDDLNENDEYRDESPDFIEIIGTEISSGLRIYYSKISLDIYGAGFYHASEYISEDLIKEIENQK